MVFIVEFFFLVEGMFFCVGRLGVGVCLSVGG